LPRFGWICPFHSRSGPAQQGAPVNQVSTSRHARPAFFRQKKDCFCHDCGDRKKLPGRPKAKTAELQADTQAVHAKLADLRTFDSTGEAERTCRCG
jgi:hypothetical protein